MEVGVSRPEFESVRSRLERTIDALRARIEVLERRPLSISVDEVPTDPTEEDFPLVTGIKRAVATFYGMTVPELVKACHRDKVRRRQVAMYLCCLHTEASLPEIGRMFNGMDHTTVLHSRRRIEELLLTDTKLQSDISLLKRQLELDPVSRSPDTIL